MLETRYPSITNAALEACKRPDAGGATRRINLSSTNDLQALGTVAVSASTKERGALKLLFKKDDHTVNVTVPFGHARTIQSTNVGEATVKIISDLAHKAIERLLKKVQPPKA